MDDVDLDKILHDLEDAEDSVKRNKAILDEYGVDYEDDGDDGDEWLLLQPIITLLKTSNKASRLRRKSLNLAFSMCFLYEFCTKSGVD